VPRTSSFEDQSGTERGAKVVRKAVMELGYVLGNMLNK
jgi:hypothetical protein